MDPRRQEIFTQKNLNDIVAKYDYYFYGIRQSIQLPIYITYATKLRNGTIIVASGPTMYIYDLEKRIATLDGHIDDVTKILTLSNGDIVSVSDDNTIRLWDPITFKCYDVLSGHTNTINDVVVMPDDTIVSCSEDRSIIVWQSSTEFKNIGGIAIGNHLTVINDKTVVIGSDHIEMRFLNVETLKMFHLRDDDSIGISAFLILKDIMVMGMDGGNLRVFSKSDLSIYSLGSYTTDEIKCLCVISDDIVVSGSYYGIVKVWNITTNKQLRKFSVPFNEQNPNTVKSIIKLPDNTVIISFRNGSIYVYDPSTGRIIFTYKEEDEESICLLRLLNNTFINVLRSGRLIQWK